MSKIDYQALRAKAEKATCGEWSLEYGKGRFNGDDALIHREVAGYIPICRIEGAHPESGFDEDFQMEQQANAEFIAEANPATVLSLLDELEAKDRRNAELNSTLERLATDRAQSASELDNAEKRIAELEALAFSPALLDVIAERQRQMSVEGWTPKHDDKYDNNELAFAASCYAFHSAAASWDFEGDGTPYDIHPAPKNWPWEPEWWKPTNPRRDMVKAGALILAEIERIDRQEAAQ